MPQPKQHHQAQREGESPRLKAFVLVSGAHVGPDYRQDPAATPAAPGSDAVILRYPSAQFKAQGTGPRVPGETNIVYSTQDLSAKFNHANSTKFRALGDAPADVQQRFEDAVASGNLDPRHGLPGGANVRFRNRPSVVEGNRTPGTSEVGPGKDSLTREERQQQLEDARHRQETDEPAPRDDRDVSPRAGAEDDEEDTGTEAEQAEDAEEEDAAESGASQRRTAGRRASQPKGRGRR